VIQLTRLNGNSLTVNCDLIKYAEASPDTMLTLVTGEKIVVRESCEEVTARAIQFRAQVLSSLDHADVARTSAHLATASVASAHSAVSQLKASTEA
jgi:flagellar protein FlbD